MPRKYTASDIVSIREDRLKVRKRPAMYIPSLYADGALHLLGEYIDNSVDELSTKDTVGHDMTVIYDKKTYECTVMDNGAGIPHEALLDAYTVLATSGKFDNGEDTAYTTSAGTFGFGSKLGVYLSTNLEVTSMRDGSYLTYIFEDGLLKDTKKGKSKEHGMVTKLIIDKSIVRIDEMDPKDLEQRLKEKSLCFPDIQIHYVLLDGGKELKKKTFSGDTLVDYVKKLKPDSDIIEVHETRKVKILKNLGDEELTETKIAIDLGLAFSEQALDMDTDAMIVSFANGMKTTQHGAHLEGAKLGMVKWFRETIQPKMSKKEQELAVTPSDITSGLCGAISVKLSSPIFASQYKAKLTNQEVKFAVRDAVFETLSDLKGAKSNHLVDFIKRVTRGRMASKKSRKKDIENAFSKDKPEKYMPIVYNMKTTCPVLIIPEGEQHCPNTTFRSHQAGAVAS